MNRGSGPATAAWGLLLFLSLAALAFALGLHMLQSDPRRFASSCGALPGFDCLPALKSRYGRVLGAPLSDYAVATYAFFALLAGLALLSPARRDFAALVMALLSAGASLFVLRLAYISATLLRAWCPLCLALHILTPLILVASLVALRTRIGSIRAILRGEARRWRSEPRLPLSLLAAIVLVFAGLPLVHRRARMNFFDEHPEYRDVLEGRSPRFVDWSDMLDNGECRGNSGAPVTVVEFVDFTCPLCREAFTVLEDLSRTHEFRLFCLDFPRGSECNPHAMTSLPGACLGALAASRAHLCSRGWLVRDALIADPSLLSDARLAAMALAADTAAILADTTAQARLAREIALARRAGVEHTPTIFVNGMKIDGMPEEWFLEEAIDREAERSRRGERS